MGLALVSLMMGRQHSTRSLALMVDAVKEPVTGSVTTTLLATKELISPTNSGFLIHNLLNTTVERTSITKTTKIASFEFSFIY